MHSPQSAFHCRNSVAFRPRRDKRSSLKDVKWPACSTALWVHTANWTHANRRSGARQSPCRIWRKTLQSAWLTAWSNFTACKIYMACQHLIVRNFSPPHSNDPFQIILCYIKVSALRTTNTCLNTQGQELAADQLCFAALAWCQIEVNQSALNQNLDSSV